MKHLEYFKINETYTQEKNVGDFLMDNVKKWFFSENDNFAEFTFWNKITDYDCGIKFKYFDKDIIPSVEKMIDFFNLEKNWQIIPITQARVGFLLTIKSKDMPKILNKLKEIDPENVKEINRLLRDLKQLEIKKISDKYNI